MWKMSIQYLVPGFEITTFWLRVSSLNHQTRAPAHGSKYFPKLVGQKVSWAAILSRQKSMSKYTLTAVKWNEASMLPLPLAPYGLV